MKFHNCHHTNVAQVPKELRHHEVIAAEFLIARPWREAHFSK